MKLKAITLSTIILSFIVISCGKKETASDLIEVSTNFNRLGKEKYRKGDTVNFELSSKYKIDSVVLKVNGHELKKTPFQIDDSFHLGVNKARLDVFYSHKKRSFDSEIKVYTLEKEKKLSYKVIATYPHDKSLFTEGFIYNNGIIYESAGLSGKSRIVKYQLGSKSLIKQRKLENKYFAEGIALFNDSLYQLTWKNRKMFLYDTDFNLIKEYDFPSGLDEGWGMTQNGKYLIISDGSSVLRYINKNDLSSIVKKTYVVGNQKIYQKINELEWSKQTLYSNMWHSNKILLINAQTGAVKATVDLTPLVKKNKENEESVLNGVAVKGNHLLVTGKNWAHIYEIKIID